MSPLNHNGSFFAFQNNNLSYMCPTSLRRCSVLFKRVGFPQKALFCVLIIYSFVEIIRYNGALLYRMKVALWIGRRMLEPYRVLLLLLLYDDDNCSGFEWG